MAGLQPLELAIGVRVPAPEPVLLKFSWESPRLVSERVRFDSEEQLHSPIAQWLCGRLLTGWFQVRVLVGELMVS